MEEIVVDQEKHLPELDAEHVQVTFWRWEQLCLAGYDVDTADLIAIKHDIDLHEACELLKSGCPLATARSILL